MSAASVATAKLLGSKLPSASLFEGPPEDTLLETYGPGKPEEADDEATDEGVMDVTNAIYEEENDDVDEEQEDVDGTECHVVKINRKSGTESVFYFDPKTFYIIRTKSKVVANGQEVESVVNMSNFQKLPEGIVMPFTMENSAVPAPITVTKVVINGPVDEATFKVSQ